MDDGGICVARTLPIDGVLLGDVLLRLRRDCPSSALRWTLGNRGIAEVDIAFASTSTPNDPGVQAWTTTARLWPNTGLARAPGIVHCTATGPDAVRVRLETTAEVPMPGLEDLVAAAVDELGEELLWYATRANITHRS
jgi:hypothetical protein